MLATVDCREGVGGGVAAAREQGGDAEGAERWVGGGGFPHGMKEPVLHINLLLAVSLAAFWKTWPSEQEAQRYSGENTCGKCVCMSEFKSYKQEKHIHSSF